MTTLVFPPELLLIILSFAESPSDLAAWTRVNRFCHRESVSRLWRGDFFGVTKAQRDEFLAFPGTHFLQKFANEKSSERFQYYIRFTRFLQLGYHGDKLASSSKTRLPFWHTEDWKDCNPWGLYISLTSNCWFGETQHYPFLKPSLRAFIKDLAIEEHGLLDEALVSTDRSRRSEEDNLPDRFWSSLCKSCPNLEYLIIPADGSRPSAHSLLRIATCFPSLKLVTLIMRRRDDLDKRTIPMFLTNQYLLSLSLTYKQSGIRYSDLKDVSCTNLRVLRIPVNDMFITKRVLLQLKQLESVQILCAFPYGSRNVTKQEIVDNVFEPLKQNPNLVCVNLRNCSGLGGYHRGGNILAPGNDIVALVESCPKLKSIEIEVWNDLDLGISEEILQQIAEKLPMLECLNVGFIDQPSPEVMASIAQSCPSLRELHLITYPWNKRESIDLISVWDYMRDDRTTFPSLEVIHASSVTWPEKFDHPLAYGRNAERIGNYTYACRQSMPRLMDIGYLIGGDHNREREWKARETTDALVEALRKTNPQWRSLSRSYATRYEEAFAEELLQTMSRTS